MSAFKKSESGTAAVEYGLLIALIAAVSIATIKSVGEHLALHWTRVDNTVPYEVPGPGNAGAGAPTSDATP